MTLKEWLAQESLTPAQFAASIGRTSEAVRRYANGERIPDKETMPLIAAATSNLVTANDFFGIDLKVEAQVAPARSSAAS